MELSVPVALFLGRVRAALFVAQSYRKRFRIDFFGRALTHTIIISALRNTTVFEELSPVVFLQLYVYEI
jgi:hypothetical protein